MSVMDTHTPIRHQQGGFLLEALIGILIFTLGVIGLMALQARAIGYSTEAQYRGEAAYLATSYISKMWADSRATLTARYDTAGEPEYDAFAAAVARLPGSTPPQVTITQAPPGGMVLANGIALNDRSTLVTVRIEWQERSNEGASGTPHNYEVTSILGVN
jgi:type IV pilus assembly protein PilV